MGVDPHDRAFGARVTGSSVASGRSPTPRPALWSLRATGHVRILTEAKVERIVAGRTAVTAIEGTVHGEPFTIEAGAFVISAGAANVARYRRPRTITPPG